MHNNYQCFYIPTQVVIYGGACEMGVCGFIYLLSFAYNNFKHLETNSIVEGEALRMNVPRIPYSSSSIKDWSYSCIWIHANTHIQSGIA